MYKKCLLLLSFALWESKENHKVGFLCAKYDTAALGHAIRQFHGTYHPKSCRSEDMKDVCPLSSTVCWWYGNNVKTQVITSCELFMHYSVVIRH